MISLDSFFDEIEKMAMEKTSAVDPIHFAGALAAGKIMLSNTIGRHAPSIRPLRWLGQEVAGIGARTAMQGKPMLSRPFREAMATTMDPKLVGLYENSHAAGKMIGNNAGAAQQFASNIRQLPQVKNMPSMMQGADFISKIPLESKGIRKVIDYGFTPVSQVGRDIKGGIGRIFGRSGSSAPLGAPTTGGSW